MGWPRAGQPVRLLEDSIRHGLSHAYLFTGPAGSGKLDTALYFLKKVFCTHSDPTRRPCESCMACRKITSGNHPDVVLVVPDGQAVKISQVRELQRAFSFKAIEAQRKAYIIQSADAMTLEAANSMLKFLEEPPFPCIAILLSSHPAKLLPTIVSRCQVVSFAGDTAANQLARLEESGVKKEYARLFAQVMTANSGEPMVESSLFAEVLQLVVQLTEDLQVKQRHPMQLVYDKIVKSGWQADQALLFLDCLAIWFRDILFVGSGLESEAVYSADCDRLAAQSKFYAVPEVLSCIDSILQAKKHLQIHGNLQLALEAMVLKMQEEVQ